MGAAVGERREFTLWPERAYGEPIEELIAEFPRIEFAQLEESGVTIEVGMQLLHKPSGPAFLGQSGVR